MGRQSRRRSSLLLARVAGWDAAAPEPPYRARYWPGSREAELTPVVFIYGVGPVVITHVGPLA